MPTTVSLQGKVIAFDLDGTLVDTAPELVVSMNYAMGQAGHEQTPVSIVRDKIGLGAKALLLAAHRYHELEVKDDRIDELLARFLEHYSSKSAHRSLPFQGAVQCLQTLRKQGARLTVCTNKRAWLTRPILEGLALAQYFSGVFCPDDVPAAKPDAAHVLAAIEPALPQNALLIGDSRTDLDAARNAGVGCFLLLHGYSIPPASELGADRCLPGFEGLATQINDWFLHK